MVDSKMILIDKSIDLKKELIALRKENERLRKFASDVGFITYRQVEENITNKRFKKIMHSLIERGRNEESATERP